MGDLTWNISELLVTGERILYTTTISEETDDGEVEIKLYITEDRVIWIDESLEFAGSKMLRFISKFSIYTGYDVFFEEDDMGNGEYGLCFGDTSEITCFWFKDPQDCKRFYKELVNAIKKQ